ncbi:MAG: hypothetical protein BWY82_00340 [Verrucomicrobia bacterium ADurb.Bin474]|nr:MAG: hypothetical protein BWY82_00340 [Verrucomicrobia bacterium ADurb.Bin474]
MESSLNAIRCDGDPDVIAGQGHPLETGIDDAREDGGAGRSVRTLQFLFHGHIHSRGLKDGFAEDDAWSDRVGRIMAPVKIHLRLECQSGYYMGVIHLNDLVHKKEGIAMGNVVFDAFHIGRNGIDLAHSQGV